MNTFPKPSRTARKLEEKKVKTARKTTEATNKQESKKRDGYRCRFPLCGCHALKLSLQAREESSHDRHKGIGGNPSGDRSQTGGLITLCRHRHQDGTVSRHKGTMRTRYLTADGSDGPVAFDIERDTLRELTLLMPNAGPERFDNGNWWIEVAREKDVQQLAPLERWQREILLRLAEMDV